MIREYLNLKFDFLKITLILKSTEKMHLVVMPLTQKLEHQPV